jgi:outer membrane biosynthesis protein TonB
MRRRELFVLLFAAAFAATGCGSKHVVRAAPPSVSTPPPEEMPPAPEPPALPPAETKTEEPPAEVPPPTPPPAPAKRPAPAPRPRPAPPETADPAPPKPAPPQISPQLSAKDLATAKNNTTSNITSSEKNLQVATGKHLSAAQKDLVEKINGFLGQAHEAILADDWVRAQNLAEKARVLSTELVKSF